MANSRASTGADYGARRTARPGDPLAAGSARASIGESFSAIVASAKQAFADLVALMTLELKHAGVTLMWMLVWGMVALLMGVTAWFGLMVAAVLGLMALNVAEAGAVLIVVAFNIIGAAAIAFWCVSASKELAMPATRRQLRIAAAEASEASIT